VKDSKILVLSDLREFSQVVAKKAISFSKQYNKPLEVLNIEEKSFFDFFKEKAEESIQKCKETLQAMYEGSDANITCEYGDFMPIVQKSIEDNNISMIIVGFKRERTFVEDLINGSYLNDIVRKTNIPVLVVKTEDEPSYKNILVPSDLSFESKENIEYLAKLFPESTLYIEHYYKTFFEDRMRFYGFDVDESNRFINHFRYEAEENLSAFVDSLSLPKTIKIKFNAKKYVDFNSMVKESIEDNDIDLLSLSTSGYVSIFSFDLLEKSPKDVIIFKIN
jgi:nucleotide-binding universal stress UspA family protein